jgi:alanyl-tRNA synthetase
MTERLYYHDSYLSRFSARVVHRSSDGLRVYLDRTAFYPDSGGQPHDTGSLGNARVLEVVDEDDRIAHITDIPVEGLEAACCVDWPRRFDHMQQHSGQHLLSAVLVELFNIPTVGFHLGADVSAIDVAAPSLTAGQILAAEARTNEIVFENRPLSVSFHESGQELGLRKASEREGTLRIVSIGDYDRSACGGTHVRATGEIGPVFLRKLDKAHGNARIEFVCGGRAVRRARADFDALSRTAKVVSAALDETPVVVAAQFEAAQAAEKTRRRMASDLARYRGAELYQSTQADECGLRRYVHRAAKGAIDEELRATAQSFTANPRAVFLAAVEEPPAFLYAVSQDSGIHAGNAVKAALAAVGGRGGGTALLAQGGAPSREALAKVCGMLEATRTA